MSRSIRFVRAAWTRDVARRMAVFAVALSLLAIPLGTGAGPAEAAEESGYSAYACGGHEIM